MDKEIDLEAKRPLAIQLNFDIKSVRRALALITGDTMTDEEINAKFFDRDPVRVDVEKMLGVVDSLQLCAGFIAIVMADGQEKKEVKKSRWQQRLEQMQKDREDRKME